MLPCKVTLLASFYYLVFCLFVHFSFTDPTSSSFSFFSKCSPRSPAWATVWSLRPVSEQNTSPQRAPQSSRNRLNSRWISPTRRARPPPRRTASTLSPSPCSQVRSYKPSPPSLPAYPACSGQEGWWKKKWKNWNNEKNSPWKFEKKMLSRHCFWFLNATRKNPKNYMKKIVFLVFSVNMVSHTEKKISLKEKSILMTIWEKKILMKNLGFFFSNQLKKKSSKHVFTHQNFFVSFLCYFMKTKCPLTWHIKKTSHETLRKKFSSKFEIFFFCSWNKSSTHSTHQAKFEKNFETRIFYLILFYLFFCFHTPKIFFSGAPSVNLMY